MTDCPHDFALAIPHLILHKVRGVPAFDIAIPLKIGNEEGWIVPTSGHRAFPFWSHPLSCLYLEYLTDGNIAYGINGPEHLVPMYIDEDWPDHYPPPDQKRAPSTKETLSLSEIGL